MNPLTVDLSQSLAAATRLELVHRRGSRFRWAALGEILLLTVGLVFVVFYLIVVGILMVVAGGSGGEGGESAGGGKSEEAKSGPTKLRVSRFQHYFVTLSLRVIGADGAVLQELETEALTERDAELFVSQALELANEQRLYVSEQIALGEEQHAREVARWYGGRPFLGLEQKRDADELEGLLVRGGCELNRSEHGVTLRRTRKIFDFKEALTALIVVPLLGAVAVLLFSLQFGPFAPFIAAALVPAALAIALVKRHAIKDALVWTLGGLVGAQERHELTVEGAGLQYGCRTLWRRQRASSEGEPLLGLNVRGALSFDRRVGPESPHVHFYGRSGSGRLPATFSEGLLGPLHEWLLLELEAQADAARFSDLSSRCAFCGSLYNWDETPSCPGCGAAHPIGGRV